MGGGAMWIDLREIVAYSLLALVGYKLIIGALGWLSRRRLRNLPEL
jgi:hypothetical protein